MKKFFSETFSVFINNDGTSEFIFLCKVGNIKTIEDLLKKYPNAIN